jgi:hypothetical protein
MSARLPVSWAACPWSREGCGRAISARVTLTEQQRTRIDHGIRCALCAQLIGVAPPGPLRSAIVPRPHRPTISPAEYWVAHHAETPVIRFGALRRDAAPKLFGNYRIDHQHPAPGARLALGVRTGTGDRIVPTPLQITARQPGADMGSRLIAAGWCSNATDCKIAGGVRWAFPCETPARLSTVR